MKEKRSMKSRLFLECNDTVLNAKEFFEEIDRLVKIDEGNDKIVVDRSHPLKKLLNRFSGGYVSPSMMKGYKWCPATQLIQSITPYVATSYTAIGTTFHSIVQDFYESDDRSYENLDLLTNKYLELNGHVGVDRDTVWHYVNGFKSLPDYLDRSKPMDHKNLDCHNEFFVKGTFEPLGVKLPLPMYCAMDRFDVRDDGIYIIDYKTGKYFSPEVFTMDGYLPQMIAYKWAIEAEFGIEVKGAYIITPGIQNKYHAMDVNSLSNQSKFLEEIFLYKDRIEELKETRAFKINQQKRLLETFEKNDMFTIKDLGDKKLIEVEYEYEVQFKEEQEDQKEQQEQ